ncbi:coiled-coil-helix-coiled-coil-helix domain-containing protein 2 [Entomortierella parvispora]|uniref:Coiled-coil-helix-coiled-coil-helix domain-containing protein 2 n=1 Tax=Entomortierella parvispora TaxID=205924 RepID=A0A9P3H6N4_9FUNG|nr:coiled-coil-helix-coiled-coil-helix domain-containing protein 2 [Entomortierella parvispora]
MARSRARAAPSSNQTRRASTMPARQGPPPSRPQPQQQHSMAPAQQAPSAMAHPNQPRQPGLFGQMASTAAGVAVGSTIGHTIGHGITSMFGGSSAPPADVPAQEQQQYQQTPQQQQYQQNYVPQQQQPYATNAAIPGSSMGSVACEADAKAFTRCLEASDNNMSVCQWYFEQLKACQSMAANY